MLGAAPNKSRLLLVVVAAVATMLVPGASGLDGLTVSTLTPTNGQTVSGKVVWEATVSGGTATKVDYFIDGKHLWTENNPPYLFNDKRGWDTTGELDGAHTLTVKAFAADGSTTTSSISVTVSNGGASNPPTPSFAVSTKTPADGETVSGKVVWEATVSGGTATRVEYFVDDKHRWTEHNPPYLFNNDAGWNTTDETNGVHSLTVKAFAADGSTTSSTTSVTVSNGGGSEPPPPPPPPPGFAVSTASPADAQTVSGKVVWEASVSGGTATRVEYFVDGELRWTERNSPYLFNNNQGWDTTGESNGSHALALKAYAADGATATSSLTVTVANGDSAPTPGSGDTTPPSTPTGLTLTSATLAGLGVKWTASTDNVGVVGYSVYRDGSLVDTISGTSYIVADLECGTTYTLGVEARDAAGNVSGRTALTARTSACVLDPEPVPSGVLYVDRDSRGGTCNDGRTALQAAAAVTPWCSLERAAAAAPSGSTVLVRQGRYDDLIVTGRTGLTFEGYPGELSVLVGEVRVDQSSAITIRHFTVTENAPGVGEVYSRLSSNVQFDDLHLDRAVFRARAAKGLTIQNSSVVNGPRYDEAVADGVFCGCAVFAGSLDGQRTSNLVVRRLDVRNMAGDGVHLNVVIGAVIEDSRFHTSHPYDTGDHVDFVQVLGAQDVTIRRNYVTDWRHGILITDKTPVDGPDADNRAMIVENNVIEATNGHAINGPVGANSLVVNNTFTGAYGIRVRWKEPRDSSSANSAGALVWNNVTPQGLSVEDGVAEDYNLASTSNRPPAAHTIIAPVTLLADYELPACSPGVNSADPARAPATDGLGRARVGAPDRGARERQGAAC